MPRLPLAAVLAVLSLSASARAQPSFVLGLGGIDGSAQALSVAVDDAGNTYLVGDFSNAVDFDPGPGEAVLTPAGGIDGFVASYGPDGRFRWAFPVGAPDQDGRFDSALGVTTDGVRAYVTGAFVGSADFDPSDREEVRTSAGITDVFVAAYDAATGAFVWVVTLGAEGEDDGRAVAVDGGSVYVSGYFEGTVDFDPSAAEAARVGAGFADGFVAAYDAVTGAFAWANTFGSPGTDRAFGVAARDGRVYATGFFITAVDFDPGPGEEVRDAGLGPDAFAVAYRAATGAFMWAVAAGDDGNDFGRSLAADGSRVYVGGSLGDASLVAYDAGTGAAAWSNVFTNSDALSIQSVAVGRGRVYAAGAFDGAVDFDPGPGVAERTTPDMTTAAFTGEYDAATGAFAGVNSLVATNQAIAYGVAVDSDRVYAAGSFRGTLDGDPAPDRTAPVGPASAGAFLVSLPDEQPVAAEPAATPAPGVPSIAPPRPNPTADRPVRFDLSLPGSAPVRAVVVDALGREVAVAYDAKVAGRVVIEVDTAPLAPGTYVLRVTTGGGAGAQSRPFTVAR